MSKNILRKKILKLRRSNYIDINLNDNLIKKIKKNVNFTKNSIIGGYYPINFEFNCLEILKKFLLKNYIVSLPIIKKNYQMDFYKWNIFDPMIINSFGIPEPFKSKKVHPDVLFVPIVAFDENNHRIGYGGGFYDRYIDKINKIKNCYTIGLAFSDQKVKKINSNKYDKKLDFILTEKFINK